MRREAPAAFYRRLARLLEAGLELPQAVEALPPTRQQELILRRVSAGEPLSAAIAASGFAVPAAHRRLIAVGEAGGALSAALGFLAEETARADRTRRRVLQAAAYPGLILLLLLLLSLGFSLRLLPAVSGLAAALDPAAALQLEGAARLLAVTAPLVVSGLCAAAVTAAVALRLSRRETRAGAICDRVILQLPGVGPTVVAARLSRVFRTAELGLEAGATLEDALAAGAGAAGGARVAGAVHRLANGLRHGDELASLVRRHSDAFPQVVAAWFAAAGAGVSPRIAVGELGRHFAADLDERLEWLARVAEPALIALAGCLLALFAAVAVSPVIDAYGAIAS